MKGLMKASYDGSAMWRGWRECAGSRSVGRPWKRWIDTVEECLRRRGLDVRQARRMVGVCKGECMRCCLCDEPQTLMLYMKPL